MEAAPLWEKQLRQWSRLKPPLRPSREDVARAQETVDNCRRRKEAAPAALVLGATPELASLDWPVGSYVVGLDLSAPMLESIWRTAPAVAGRRSAIQGNWMAIPCPDQRFDLVLADGSFTLVRQRETPLLAGEVRRVLREDGVLQLRAWTRPEKAETPAEVREQLLGGRIGSFHIFKFRLLMSLNRGAGEVAVADAWEFFQSQCPPAETVADLLDWPLDEIQTIHSYRGQDSVYWFPTHRELLDALDDHFREVECRWPSYELGDRCPTLRLEPRA